MCGLGLCVLNFVYIESYWMYSVFIVMCICNSFISWCVVFHCITLCMYIDICGVDQLFFPSFFFFLIVLLKAFLCVSSDGLYLSIFTVLQIKIENVQNHCEMGNNIVELF